MGDAQHTSTLLPPSTGTFTPATPSGLTPNTRSEAEAALTLNSVAQTDSAAPTTPLPAGSAANMFPGTGAGGGNEDLDILDEARKAYRRPGGPVRTSSTNYENALHKAREQSSVSSNLSTDTSEPEPNITGTAPVGSPTNSTPVPANFPPPGQGVVPLHTGVGGGQAEAVKKVRPSGLSLGDLGRKQSWNEQDMKHVYSAGLMGEIKGDAGYSSGTEERH